MTYNLDVLSQEIFNLAKGNFNRSVFCKLAIYVLGAAALFVLDRFSVFPILTVLSVVASEVFQHRSDTFRRIAESLRRKLDFQNSFGWDVSPAEIADIIARLPASVEQKANSTNRGDYFCSGKAPGPTKAFKNLEESSWYSKHLAEIAYHYCVLIVAVIVVGSFMDRADKIEIAAFNNAKVKDVTEIDALKSWSEYHIARAGSPLIPEIIWQRKGEKLNRLFRAHRRSD